MEAEEAFRVAIYRNGVRVGSDLALKKYRRVEHAVRRMLHPLRLGERLAFEFQLAEDGLWAVVMIKRSGQLSLIDEVAESERRESVGEPTVATELFLLAARKLRELMAQVRVHGAVVETIQAEMANIGKEELALAVEGPDSGDDPRICMEDADLTRHDIHLGSLPARRLRLSEVSASFNVRWVSRDRAGIRLDKASRGAIGGHARAMELLWEPIQDDHSDVPGSLFRSMMSHSMRTCSAVPLTSKSGEVVGLLLVALK